MSENGNTGQVIAWIIRMSERYGGVIHDLDGNAHDWGQALCRECYGPDWVGRVPDAPAADDVSRALDWERGEWPEWVAENPDATEPEEER